MAAAPPSSSPPLLATSLPSWASVPPATGAASPACHLLSPVSPGHVQGGSAAGRLCCRACLVASQPQPRVLPARGGGPAGTSMALILGAGTGRESLEGVLPKTHVEDGPRGVGPGRAGPEGSASHVGAGGCRGLLPPTPHPAGTQQGHHLGTQQPPDPNCLEPGLPRPQNCGKKGPFL